MPKRRSTSIVGQPATAVAGSGQSSGTGGMGGSGASNGNAMAGSSLPPDGSAMPEDMLCLCRSSNNDDKRFMIQCDGCERWYHGECVDVEEATADFLDKFYCPPCAAKGLDAVWRRECQRHGCQHATRDYSKYCSEECGMLTAMRRARATHGDTAAATAPTTNGVEEQAIRQLDERAAQSEARLAGIQRRQARLEDNISAAAESMAEQCAFSEAIILDSDDEVEAESTPSRCGEPIKTCRRHRGWRELRRADLNKELVVQQAKVLECAQERQLIMLKIRERQGAQLLPADTKSAAPAPTPMEMEM